LKLIVNVKELYEKAAFPAALQKSYVLWKKATKRAKISVRPFWPASETNIIPHPF